MKLSKEEVVKRIFDKYGDQISFVGRYWNRQVRSTLYCHKCENFFRQKVESLFRGYKTRCKCNFSERLTEGFDLQNHSGGHTCVRDYDVDYLGLEVPSDPSQKPSN